MKINKQLILEGFMKTLDRTLNAGAYKELKSQLEFHRSEGNRLSGEIDRTNKMYNSYKNSSDGPALGQKLKELNASYEQNTELLNHYSTNGLEGIKYNPTELKVKQAQKNGFSNGMITGAIGGGLTGAMLANASGNAREAVEQNIG